MLKIAEYNKITGKKIELSDLEKFDFVYYDSVGQYKYCEKNIDGATYIYVNVWNRKILYRQDKSCDTFCLSVLYDLIEAGYVEKVEE